MIKPKSIYGQAFMFLALSLLLAGCGKSVSQIIGEKAAEKIMEKGAGDGAKVDVNNDKVKIENKEGKFEAGGDIKLPDGFPKDIYVIEGKILAAATGQEGDGSYTISIEADKNLDEINSLYQEKLKAEGWNITGTINFGDSASVLAEKDTRSVSVTIGKSESKTSVVITVAKK